MTFGPGFAPRPDRRPAIAGSARGSHRHDLQDPECRSATLAELRPALAAAEQLATALELGAEATSGELRLAIEVLERLDRRIMILEALDRGR